MKNGRKLNFTEQMKKMNKMCRSQRMNERN